MANEYKYFVGTEEAWNKLSAEIKAEYGDVRYGTVKDAVDAAKLAASAPEDQIVFDVSSTTESGIVTISGITGNVTVKEYSGDVTLHCGFKIAQSNVTIDGFTFAENAIETNAFVIQVAGSKAAPFSDVKIINNTFATGASYTNDIICANGAKDLVVSGNKVTDGEHHGINLYNLSGITTVTGNTISGVARSGIQFAWDVKGEVNVSGNEITLSKTNADRVDLDDAAIVLGGNSAFTSYTAQWNITNNKLTVSGTGRDGMAVSAVAIGNNVAMRAQPSPELGCLNLSGNAIDFSDGAKAVANDLIPGTTIDASKNTFTVDSVKATHDQVYAGIAIPSNDPTMGVTFSYVNEAGATVIDIVGQQNPDPTYLLVDKEIYFNRAHGEAVTIDGKEYIVGDNLFGTIQEALDRVKTYPNAIKRTILIDGTYDETVNIAIGGLPQSPISFESLKEGSAIINGGFDFTGADNTVNIILSGLTINSNGNAYAITVDSTLGEDSRITGNAFNGNGINATGTASVGIYGNTFNGGEDTIGINAAAGTTLNVGGTDAAKGQSGNKINNGVDALGSTFTSNTISDAEIGSGINFKNNTVSDELIINGAITKDDTKALISGNTIGGNLIIDPDTTKDLAKEISGANGNASAVYETMANTKAIVSLAYKGYNAGDVLIVDGKKAIVGTNLFSDMESAANQAPVTEILVKDMDSSIVDEIGFTGREITYTFANEVSFGDLQVNGKVTINGKVEFSGTLIGDGSGANNKIWIANNSIVTLGGSALNKQGTMIDADAFAGFEFSPQEAKKILGQITISGNLFILGTGANATALIANLNTTNLTGTGAIYVQGLGGNYQIGNVSVNTTVGIESSLTTNLLETLAAPLTQRILTGAPTGDVLFELNKDAGNKTSISDIYAGTIGFGNDKDLTVNIGGGDVFLRGEYQNIDALAIDNKGSLAGSLPEEAASFTAATATVENRRNAVLNADVATTGILSATNRGTISGTYDAAGLLTFSNIEGGKMEDVNFGVGAGGLSFTNGTGSTWKGGEIIAAGNVTLVNDGSIADVAIDAAANKLTFKSSSTIQGNYQDMEITAGNVYLGGANLSLAEGSDIGVLYFSAENTAEANYTPILSNGYAQTLTITDSKVKAIQFGSGWIRPLAFASDTASFTIVLKGDTVLNEAPGYVNAIRFVDTVPSFNMAVDITVNMYDQSIINGTIANQLGAISSATELVVTGHIKAQDEIDVKGDLSAQDIEAAGAIFAGGDLTANSITLTSVDEKAAITVNGNAMTVGAFNLDQYAVISAKNVNILAPLPINYTDGSTQIAGIEANSIRYTAGDIDDFKSIKTTGRIIADAGNITAEVLQSKTGTIKANNVTVTGDELTTAGSIDTGILNAKKVQVRKDAASHANGSIDVASIADTALTIDAEGRIDATGTIAGRADIKAGEAIAVAGAISAKTLTAGVTSGSDLSIRGSSIDTTGNITATGRVESTLGGIITGKDAVITAKSLVAAGLMDVGGISVSKDGMVAAGTNLTATEITQAGKVRANGGNLVVGITRYPVPTNPNYYVFVGGTVNASSEVFAQGEINVGDITAASITSQTGNILVGQMENAGGLLRFVGSDIVITGAALSADGNIVGGSVASHGAIMAKDIKGAGTEGAAKYAGAIQADSAIAAGNDPYDGILIAQGDVVAASIAAGKNIEIAGNVDLYKKDEANAGNIASANGSILIDGNVQMAGSITAAGKIDIGSLTEITGAVISYNGAIEIDNLGNVGGNQVSGPDYEGFALWAMNTKDASTLGFVEGAKINGDIGLGYGADTFSLVNAPVINGDVFFGGVEEQTAFDTLVAGANSSYTGNFDLTRHAAGRNVYGNLRIEGGSLDLNGGSISGDSIDPTFLGSTLAMKAGSLANATIDEIDTVVFEEDGTFNNVAVTGQNFPTALRINAGKTATFSGAGTFADFNALDFNGSGTLKLQNQAAVAVEATSFLKEGESIEIASASSMFLSAAQANAGIAGTISVSGRDSALTIRSATAQNTVLTGEIKLSDNADLNIATNLNVNNGKVFSEASTSSAVHVLAGAVLTINTVQNDLGKTGSLELSDGSHLLNSGNVIVNDGIITLKSNGYIQNLNGGQFRFNDGGTFNIETNALIDAGFSFQGVGAKTDIIIKNATATFAKGVRLDGLVSMSGEGNAAAKIEASFNGNAQPGYAKDILTLAQDFEVRNFALEVINDSTVQFPMNRDTVLEVKADLVLNGNFSVKADVLHAYNTADISVDLSETDAADFLFQIGSYEGFADTVGGQGQRIALTIDAAAEKAWSYKIAEGTAAKAQYFTVGAGFEGYQMAQEADGMYLKYSLAPTFTLTVGEQQDGYVYNGSIVLDNPDYTASVSYQLGDAVVAVDVAADGTFSIVLDPSAAVYPNFTVTANVVDPVGNSASASEIRAIADVTAPVLGMKLDSAVAYRTATISWDSATDNVAVTGYKLTVNDQVYDLAADATSAELKDLERGSYSYTLEAFDAAGNRIVSESKSFEINPEPVFTVTVDDQTNGYVYNGQVNLIDKEAYTVTASYKLGEDVVSVDVAEDGSFSIVLDPTSARIGEFTVSVTVSSLTVAGSTVEIVKAIADVTDPVLGMKLDSAVAYRTATISWDSATDNVAVTGYKLTVNDQVYDLAADATSAELKDLERGSYSYTLEAFDAAGNRIVSESKSFEINPEPVFTVTVDDQTNGYVYNGQVNLIDKEAYTVTASYKLGEDVVSVDVAEDGSFSIVLDPTSARIGEFTVSVNVTASGIVGSTVEIVKSIADVTAPVLGDKLNASADHRNVSITWDSASDNVAVTGYKLTFNGQVYDLDADATSYGFDNLKRGSYEYKLEAFDAAGNMVSSSANTVSVTPKAVTQDVDDNGLSDVILAHSAGFAGAWFVAKDDTISWGNLSTMGDNWKIYGAGNTRVESDPTYNTASDIYLFDEKAGNVIAWEVEDGKVTGFTGIANLDTNTKLLGLGDFNGNGQTDLLLQDKTTGVLGYAAGGSEWKEFTSTGLGENWSVVGVADMNGNGISDLILRDSKDGNVGTWLIGGKEPVWADLDKLTDSQKILGTGDFNGDGVEDVLIGNSENGSLGAWIVKDGSVSGWMGLGSLESGAEVENIGDFNGDGIADLQVRTDSGAIGALIVNGEDDLSWKYYGSVGNEWTSKLA